MSNPVIDVDVKMNDSSNLYILYIAMVINPNELVTLSYIGSFSRLWVTQEAADKAHDIVQEISISSFD